MHVGNAQKKVNTKAVWSCVFSHLQFKMLWTRCIIISDRIVTQVNRPSIDPCGTVPHALHLNCSLKATTKQKSVTYYLSFGDIVHHTDGSQWGQVVTPGMVIHLKHTVNFKLSIIFQHYAMQK